MPRPPLGTGQRFAALKSKLASRGNVENPGALAAAIGRKKYGAKKMGKMAAHGRGMALGGPVPEPDVDNPKGFAKGGMAHGQGCSCKMCRGGMA